LFNSAGCGELPLGRLLPELTTPQKHHSFRLLAYLEKGGDEVVEMVHKEHDANIKPANLLLCSKMPLRLADDCGNFSSEHVDL
jgi:hypothetical protein